MYDSKQIQLPEEWSAYATVKLIYPSIHNRAYGTLGAQTSCEPDNATPQILGPEVWRDEVGRLYCPFKHDIYQLSTRCQ